MAFELIIRERLMSVQNKTLNHVLIITAYKNYEQLHEYLSFYVNYYDVYLHIDKKSRLSDCELRRLREISENIVIIKKYKINWGSYKHLLAILDLLSLAQASPKHYDYYHIISGDDFLIKPPSQIQKFFESNIGRSYLELIPVLNDKNLEVKFNHYYFMHLFDYRKKLRLISRMLESFQVIFDIKRNITFKYKGLVWCTLYSDAVRFCLNYINEHKEYLERLKYCYVPEEFFFQNILMESYLKDTIVNDCLRFNIWGIKGRKNPAVLNENDYEDIVKSKQIFGRKIIMSGESKKLYEQLVNYISD